MAGQPFFNKPPFEKQFGIQESGMGNKGNNVIIRYGTVKYATTEMMHQPRALFDDVIKAAHGHLKSDEIQAIAFRYWFTLKYLRCNRYSNCSSNINVYTYYILLALIGIILCFVRIAEYDAKCAEIKSKCDGSDSTVLARKLLFKV